VSAAGVTAGIDGALRIASLLRGPKRSSIRYYLQHKAGYCRGLEAVT
jgi:hypothetical protein